MTEEIKKQVLKAIDLYIEGEKNPAGGPGKKPLLNGLLCLIMKMESLLQFKLSFQLWIQLVLKK